MTQAWIRMLSTTAASLLATLAMAADRYVAPDGDDSAAGTIAAPLRTIARGLALAQPGDTVVLRAGTWRENVVITRGGRSGAPITIAAHPGETPVLKGSRVVTGWTQHAGEVWKKTGWTVRSQQVFVDGAGLQQIGLPSSYYTGQAADGSTMFYPVGSGLGDLARGRFWYDAAASTLYVQLADGGDPNARTVEASTAHRILYVDPGAGFITLRGLTFRHSATAAYQYGGAAVELGDDCVMEDCDLQLCDVAGVAPGWRRSRARIERCVIANNGNMGINGSGCYDFTVRDCVLDGNNTRPFNPQWAGGGAKFTAQAWGVVERCSARGNRGHGIWFDYCDSGNPIVVRANRIAGNSNKGEGLIAEASRNLRFTDNVIEDNERRGIYISASEDVLVAHNTLVGNRGWCALDLGGGMPRSGKALRNVTVRNNILADNRGSTDARVFVENGTDIVGLRWDYNLVWRPSGTVFLWYGQDARGSWSGTTYTSVSGWRSGTPHGDHDRQADPRFADAERRLAVDSPALDTGTPVSQAAVDRAGTPRPQGGGWDLGAWERVATGNAAPSLASATAVLADDGVTAACAAVAGDDGGVAALTWTWSATGPADVVFSAQAANPTATFRAVGDYVLSVVVADAGGLTARREVPLRVAARAAAIAVAPATATIARGGSVAFTASVRDQFGVALALQPAVAWTVDGGGAIDDAGAFTAGGSAGGPWTVTAIGGAASGTAAVTVAGDLLVRVNFQPASAATVPGWLVDAGEPFADRGNGQVYGWNARVGDLRDRNDPAAPDQLHDTLVYTQKAPNKDARWELAVPDGTYRVRVVAGDPTVISGRYAYAVEGVTVLDAAPTAAVRWVEGEAVVTVADGRLTLANAAGARVNRVCLIEIAAVPAGNG